MTERNRDRSKIWWAVLASLVLHLLIGLSLASIGGTRQDITIEENPVPQLTIVPPDEPTPPPLVPKNAPHINVDESRKSDVAPKVKTFEANENSIAAAEKAATTDNELPGQEGKDRPFMNLEDHDYSLATKGARTEPKPTPVATPDQKPTPSETATPATAATPQQDQLALLTQTPTPVPSPAETEEKTEVAAPTPTPTPTPEVTPPNPASSYRDWQQKNLIRGGINNRGRSAVNAVGTPLGRYRKLLEDAIGSRWYYYVRAHPDLINIGTTTVTFTVASDGSVKNMRIVENTGNEASAGIALRSIQESKFPPIPEELHDTFPDGRLLMEETFSIFPNR